MPPRLLSKSRYLNGMQCLKYLWIVFHEAAKLAEPDSGTQYLFDQGHEVGELAKELFPGGVDIPSADFMGNIRQTRRLLEQRKTLFEAALMVDRLYSRVDILQPAGEDAWDIIEVKSGTRVKDVDLEDVAFQKYCCRKAGLDIRKCYLMNIDNEYVRHGDLEPEKLFRRADITERVDEIIPLIDERVEEMLQIVSSDRMPDLPIGRHCNSPYECPVEECHSFLPDYSVLELYRAGQKGYDLLEDGILTIMEIPDSFELTVTQQIQKEVIATGRPHIDAGNLAGFLEGLHYPLHYLDFETFSTAIPRFDDTRPYQNVPFQFSLDIVGRPGGPVQHHAFLAEGRGDTRPAFLAALRASLGQEGDIVVYNQSFEAGVLKDLGEAFPEYTGFVGEVTGRLVDLFAPFRNMWYYHPAQKGSASLKAVLPAVAGKDYKELTINQGELASIEFQRVTYNDVPEEERQRVRQDLLEYCGLDTGGMVDIVNELERLVKPAKPTQGRLL